MNLIHKQVIADNLVKSITQLLGGTVKYQSVYTPKGKPIERIVIEYERDE